MAKEDKSVAEIMQGLLEGSKALQESQVEHFSRDLVDLMTGPTSKEAIKSRPGRGGEYPYIPLYYAVAWLNAFFGFMWDIIIVDKGIVEENVEIIEDIIPPDLSPGEVGNLRIKGKLEKNKYNIKVPTQVWALGYLVIKIPGKAITQTDYQADGVTVVRKTETKTDPIIVTKYAFGGVDIKVWGEKSDNAGMIIDLGDDYKSAFADVLKKAGSYLGLWSDVYGKRELLEEAGPTDGQLTALYKRAEEKNWNTVKLLEHCKKSYECTPEGLNPAQYLKLMRELLGIRILAPKELIGSGV